MSVETWNTRYATEDYIFGTEPSPFLKTCRDSLPATGRALSVADGEGRNGVWLAAQGLDVLSLDFSAEGLAKAQRLAAEHGVPLHTEQADILTWTWPKQAFNVVCAMNFHFPPAQREPLFRHMVETLAPGGVLLFEGIHTDTRDHHAPDSLFNEAMMPGLLAGLDIRTMTTRMDNGQRHAQTGAKKKLNVLAVKPA